MAAGYGAVAVFVISKLFKIAMHTPRLLVYFATLYAGIIAIAIFIFAAYLVLRFQRRRTLSRQRAYGVSIHAGNGTLREANGHPSDHTLFEPPTRQRPKSHQRRVHFLYQSFSRSRNDKTEQKAKAAGGQNIDKAIVIGRIVDAVSNTNAIIKDTHTSLQPPENPDPSQKGDSKAADKTDERASAQKVIGPTSASVGPRTATAVVVGPKAIEGLETPPTPPENPGLSQKGDSRAADKKNERASAAVVGPRTAVREPSAADVGPDALARQEPPPTPRCIETQDNPSLFTGKGDDAALAKTTPGRQLPNQEPGQEPQTTEAFYDEINDSDLDSPTKGKGQRQEYVNDYTPLTCGSDYLDGYTPLSE